MRSQKQPQARVQGECLPRASHVQDIANALSAPSKLEHFDRRSSATAFCQQRFPLSWCMENFVERPFYQSCPQLHLRPIDVFCMVLGGQAINANLFLPNVKGNQKLRETSAPTASNIAHETNYTSTTSDVFGATSVSLRTGREKIDFRVFCCKILRESLQDHQIKCTLMPARKLGIQSGHAIITADMAMEVLLKAAQPPHLVKKMKFGIFNFFFFWGLLTNIQTV